MTADRLLVPDTLVSNIVTLQVYIRSSPSIKNSNWRVLRKLLPLEVVGLMVTLLSFVMTPPGPCQLIITELRFTPTAPLTVQVTTSGLPTITWLLDIAVVTVMIGAVCIYIQTMLCMYVCTYPLHPM